ncbi:MAG: PH domain-containing protein [Clostridiales bacterium]|nr:PH domain-containing protein [Clostridiales bacterium]
MRFEPVEKRNEKDNSIQFYLRSSLVPVLAYLILSSCFGFLYLFSDTTTRTGRLISLLSFGFWFISFIGFSAALVARISTLVFVTKYRIYGQVYGFLPSHRQIEISLEEIKDLEVRATIGTRVFKYAHLIIHPYNGKKIKLRNIRNAEELAVIILKTQDKLLRMPPEKKDHPKK